MVSRLAVSMLLGQDRFTQRTCFTLGRGISVWHGLSSDKRQPIVIVLVFLVITHGHVPLLGASPQDHRMGVITETGSQLHGERSRR
jgi:hypothetical protein